MSEKVPAHIEIVAMAFAEMNDDDQTQFFCRVAALAENWRKNKNGLGPEWQWERIGQHLAECECATEGGRALIRGIAESMNDYEERKRKAS